MIRATERRNEITPPGVLVGLSLRFAGGAGADDIPDSWVAGLGTEITVAGFSSRAEETFRFANSVMV
jgi:hypothetical protein